MKCLIKNENVLPELAVYAKLLEELYTGRNEKIASNATIDQIKRSPFMLLKIVPIVLRTFPQRGNLLLLLLLLSKKQILSSSVSSFWED